MESVKLPLSAVRHIIEMCYGRTSKRKPVSVCPATTYHVRNYWDGGSKDESVFLNLQTMQILNTNDLPKEARKAGLANPFNLPVADIDLQPQIIVVEHSIFCGKDIGYSIYAHPDLYNFIKNGGIENLQKLEYPKAALPATVEAE